jgi:plasmid stabilization system protein ParE
MPYLVRLADRALRDMEAIYEFIDAETSESAFAWFNELAREVYSLERFPERGAVIPESKKLRHLLFGENQAPIELSTRWTNATMLLAFSTYGTVRGRRFRQKKKSSYSSLRIQRLLCSRDSLLPSTRTSRFSVPR